MTPPDAFTACAQAFTACWLGTENSEKPGTPEQLQISPTLIGVPLACAGVEPLDGWPLDVELDDELLLLDEHAPKATVVARTPTSDKTFRLANTRFTLPCSDDILIHDEPRPAG